MNSTMGVFDAQLAREAGALAELKDFTPREQPMFDPELARKSGAIETSDHPCPGSLKRPRDINDLISPRAFKLARRANP